MIIKTVKLSGKGQIAIPQDMRREAKLKKGDKLIVIEDDGKLMLEKAEKISARVKDDFKDMLRNSERVAEKLWSNKADEIWDTI